MRKKRMDKIEDRVALRERRYTVERLMRRKRSEEWEVLEEVFDRPTLLRLYRLLNKGSLSKIHGSIKAGKESRIYWGEGPNGEEVAVKIYLTVSSEFKRRMLNYIRGDPRFPKIKKDTRSLINLWAKKEYKNLMRAFKAGLTVPRPLTVNGNILIMEFIGEGGIPAPLLKDVFFSDMDFKRAQEIYHQVLTMVNTLYNKAELVHADLSEYNIMMWKDRPVLIDFSQSVHREHPSADTFLRRDLENLNFFSKRGVRTSDIEKLIEWVMKNHE